MLKLSVRLLLRYPMFMYNVSVHIQPHNVIKLYNIVGKLRLQKYIQIKIFINVVLISIFK